MAALYESVRSASEPTEAWEEWTATRDELFATHPQSPLQADARDGFEGLEYFDYDPELRVLAALEPAEPDHFDIPTSGDTTMSFTRFGTAAFELSGNALALDVYWLEGYAGGVFLPYRDATSGNETYGAGRYVLDTIKGADLGSAGDRLVLDLNFSYNPSCAYDPRWVCPLAPPSNRLEVEVRVGEKTPGEQTSVT